MAVIESEVRLTGRDAGVAAMFESISKKIDQVSRASKISKPFSSLVEGLTAAEAQAKALAKVDTKKAIAEISRQKALAVKEELEQQRQLVAAQQAPTKAMQRSLAAREVAHAKIMEIHRREHAAYEASVKAAEALGLSVGHGAERGAQQQAELARTIERTTEAMRRQVGIDRQAAEQRAALDRTAHQRREFFEKRGVRHMVVQGVGNAIAAHSIAGGVEHVVEEGANLAHTKNVASTAGIGAFELSGITDQALDLSRRYKNVSQEALIEVAKEARSALVHPDEVHAVMPTLAAAKSVLDGIDKSGEAGGNLGALVKGAESIGAAQDPERLSKLIDAYVKGIQVMGKTINPDQIYEFDKYSKTAGARMSDRFLMTTGLSLSQELGGSTAANDIFQAQKAIVGGFQNKHVPLKEMVRVGMIGKDDVTYTKTGEAKGLKPGRKVFGSDKAATDLDTWVYEDLLPHLQSSGITKRDDQLDFVTRTFTGAAADVISKLITQRESFEAHAQRYGEASGIKGADTMATDPIVAWQGFTTQLSNLAANLAEGPAKAAGPALDAMATGIGNLSAQVAEFNKAHPDLAPAVEAAGGVVAAGVGTYVAGKALSGSVGMFGRWLGLKGGQAAAGEVVGGIAGGEAGAVAGTIGGAAGVGLPTIVGLGGLGLGIMGGTVYGLSHALPTVGQRGRAQPASQNDTDRPGHLVKGRGGAPIWVEDAIPKPSLPTIALPAAQDEHTLSSNAQDDTAPGTFRPVSARRADLPTFAAAPSVSPMPASPQAVDVAVTVGDPKFDGSLRISTEPSQWFISKVDFLSQQFSMGPSSATAKPSTGPTMPGAGQAPHTGGIAHPAGRGD